MSALADAIRSSRPGGVAMLIHGLALIQRHGGCDDPGNPGWWVPLAVYVDLLADLVLE